MYMPRRFKEVEAPRFRENRHIMVVRLPSLRLGRLYSQVLLLAFIYVRGWVDPRTMVRPEGLSHWRIPVTKSGNGTSDLLLVAQYCNQARHRVLKFVAVKVGKSYRMFNMKTTFMRLCVYYRCAQAYMRLCVYYRCAQSYMRLCVYYRCAQAYMRLCVYYRCAQAYMRFCVYYRCAQAYMRFCVYYRCAQAYMRLCVCYRCAQAYMRLCVCYRCAQAYMRLCVCYRCAQAYSSSHVKD